MAIVILPELRRKEGGGERKGGEKKGGKKKNEGKGRSSVRRNVRARAQSESFQRMTLKEGKKGWGKREKGRGENAAC